MHISMHLTVLCWGERHWLEAAETRVCWPTQHVNSHRLFFHDVDAALAGEEAVVPITHPQPEPDRNAFEAPVLLRTPRVSVLRRFRA